MDVLTLCAELSIPDEARLQVEKRLASQQWPALREFIVGMTDPDTAEDAYLSLMSLVKDDDMSILAAQLEAAVLTCEKYRAMDIPDQVFFDTMKCFSRFLEETKRITGKYCYDRAFWAWRQTSMLIFRVGELEYELKRGDGSISIHIPSDACFSSEAVGRSLELSRAFIRRYFPDCREYPYVCHSWLLSPELKGLLDEQSNILSFQRRFRILSVQPEEREFKQWLFEAGLDTPAAMLREDTSLQRKAKALLLRGGNIGAARGVLI